MQDLRTICVMRLGVVAMLHNGKLYVTKAVFSSDRLKLHGMRVPWLSVGVNPLFEQFRFFLCYIVCPRTEDRATLGSDPSAEVGG